MKWKQAINGARNIAGDKAWSWLCNFFKSREEDIEDVYVTSLHK